MSSPIPPSPPIPATPATPGAPTSPPPAGRWQRFSAGFLRAFHAYAGWLVSISWKRFAVLAVLLLVVTALLEDLPPFSWTITETIEHEGPSVKTPVPPASPVASGAQRREPVIRIEKARPASDSDEGVSIVIGGQGIRIVPHPKAAPSASAPSEPSAPGSGAAAAEPAVSIQVPQGADSEQVREAVQEAREAIVEAIREAREAEASGADARAQARASAPDTAGHAAPSTRKRTVKLGSRLPDMALLWIFASIIIKITYKGQLRAEAKAAVASETAEAEQLKRQLAEARMAAMQAQVEPHFLFNTLASIDHLIETDPPRASQMQKNLIALLRASMPTLRESNPSGVRELGQEMAVIRPYLEILKVRMEDRLQTELDVPEGLLSAEFPPMMLQSLVENAIKHGLEPKAEGGTLRVHAEIRHGKLVVSVADTGLGWGRAATAGTGTGLGNIRERLQLLYGARAALQTVENQPSGSIVSITVPYRAAHVDEPAAA
ncbi:sensor histidine kinase [Sphaerotilus microaerophilus]|uniref:Histidine kinase/HSP90-like ATPase domain-containing protein n=1 Tax=Sphaerotilus microaerophilus TaxID=2914710 RepID=A0ABM7YG00_9BURK|nr:histidine kinase [Sphaerotilus sp. FB-5]BDI03063.1 hypothetical protein CATMQ487_00330 [Sphaerotilus sp. FB-5]